jgi:hypothetical protein
MSIVNLNNLSRQVRLIQILTRIFRIHLHMYLNLFKLVFSDGPKFIKMCISIIHRADSIIATISHSRVQSLVLDSIQSVSFSFLDKLLMNFPSLQRDRESLLSTAAVMSSSTMNTIQCNSFQYAATQTTDTIQNPYR